MDAYIKKLQRHYELLGVAEDSTPQTIRKRYLKAVKKWHPDLFPPESTSQTLASDHMRALIEAYDAIGDAPLKTLSSRPQIEWLPLDDDQLDEEDAAQAGQGFAGFRHATRNRANTEAEFISATRRYSASLIPNDAVTGLITQLTKFCFGVFLTLPMAAAAIDHPVWILPTLLVSLATGWVFTRLAEDSWKLLSKPISRL